MEPIESSGVPGATDSAPEAQLDRMAQLEIRVRQLEERVPRTQLLDRRLVPRAFAVLGHYLVAGLIMYAAAFAVLLPLGALLDRFAPDATEDIAPREAVIRKGAPLSTVASLPVDALGAGTLTGAPTGEAAADDYSGSFILALVPAPAGIKDGTTVRIAVDRSTKAYRGSTARELGSPLEAMNGGGWPNDADPSSAGTVVVRYHLRGGEVLADRLELSDEPPPGFEW